VPGIKVGHCTIVEGSGKLIVGKGPVRTGVTVILPHSGDLWNDRCSAGFFSLNGCGVVTGSDWINECGALEGPIALTNSHSVGDVGRAMSKLMQELYPQIGTTDDAYLPVVGECDDSPLNDLNGFHVQDKHVREAIDKASSDCPAEGAVGAGTGMTCYGFKGGIGTASRQVLIQESTYTVAALVNTNHGQTHQLLIDGVAVGRTLKAEMQTEKNKEGSIVLILATDAPLNQRQLERLSRRACMGLARTGSVAGNGSGDFALSFSTGRRVARQTPSHLINLPELHNDHINILFEAAAESAEEAILNSIFVADTVIGRDDNSSKGLPVERAIEILQEHGRLKS
jgi:D-aminopeptidase